MYRAKDAKPDRDVAIKVLSAAFAKHPEQLAGLIWRARRLRHWSDMPTSR